MLQALLTIVGAGVILFLTVGFTRSLYVQFRQQPRVFKYHVLHLSLWVLAVVSLSGCLATFRRLSGEQPNLHPFLNLFGGGVYLLALLGACLVLGFFMYREDSRNGKLRRRFGLYERFLPQP